MGTHRRTWKYDNQWIRTLSNRNGYPRQNKLSCCSCVRWSRERCVGCAWWIGQCMGKLVNGTQTRQHKYVKNNCMWNVRMHTTETQGRKGKVAGVEWNENVGSLTVCLCARTLWQWMWNSIAGAITCRWQTYITMHFAHTSPRASYQATPPNMRPNLSRKENRWVLTSWKSPQMKGDPTQTRGGAYRAKRKNSKVLSLSRGDA